MRDADLQEPQRPSSTICIRESIAKPGKMTLVNAEVVQLLVNASAVVIHEEPCEGAGCGELRTSSAVALNGATRRARSGP